MAHLPVEKFPVHSPSIEFHYKISIRCIIQMVGFSYFTISVRLFDNSFLNFSIILFFICRSLLLSAALIRRSQSIDIKIITRRTCILQTYIQTHRKYKIQNTHKTSNNKKSFILCRKFLILWWWFYMVGSQYCSAFFVCVCVFAFFLHTMTSIIEFYSSIVRIYNIQGRTSIVHENFEDKVYV